MQELTELYRWRIEDWVCATKSYCMSEDNCAKRWSDAPTCVPCLKLRSKRLSRQLPASTQLLRCEETCMPSQPGLNKLRKGCTFNSITSLYCKRKICNNPVTWAVLLSTIDHQKFKKIVRLRDTCRRCKDIASTGLADPYFFRLDGRPQTLPLRLREGEGFRHIVAAIQPCISLSS